MHKKSHKITVNEIRHDPHVIDRIKDKKLRNDLKLIMKSAGILKLKMNFTPEELNAAFEQSYESEFNKLRKSGIIKKYN